MFANWNLIHIRWKSQSVKGKSALLKEAWRFTNYPSGLGIMKDFKLKSKFRLFVKTNIIKVMLKSFKYQRNMETHFNRIPVLNVVNHKPIRQCTIFDLSLTLLNDPGARSALNLNMIYVVVNYYMHLIRCLRTGRSPT